MTPVPQHLIVAPILIPLVAGAIMLLYDERQRRMKLALGLASGVMQVICAVLLLEVAEGTAATGHNAVGLYLLGDWPSPFGIVLVVDRLSAMMLVLTSILAVPALLYSAAGWHQRGQHFHPLFQFLLMGLNGAFLTGDLFNLFVFFEVMLAASYGLLLHGSGRLRVGAGVHYIAVNLTASLMFLLGVALIYGVVGTLNMADLATRIPYLPDADRLMVHAAAAILAVAFLTKAAMWPLCFWLTPAYMSANPPSAAMFAIMTKVGVYVILRLGLLLFGAGAGASAGFGAEVLVFGGMATVIFGTTGVLSAQSLGRMGGNLVLVSSGTVLAVAGFALQFGSMAMLAGALYYTLGSTLAIAALFLMSEPMSREQGGIAALLALSADAYGFDAIDDEEPPADEGYRIPGGLTVLSICFAFCVLMLAGLPPLAGFVGKFAMMAGAVSGAADAALPGTLWLFILLLLASGLATMIAMVRLGIQTFWANDDSIPPVDALEVVPIAGLVAVILVLTVEGEGVMRYMDRTAQALSQPAIYINGVVAPAPAPAEAAPALPATSAAAESEPAVIR